MIRNTTLVLTAFLLAPLAALHAADTIVIPVDSPAIVFSPGNWTGDEGRAGKSFRQTWNPGAYFRVTWETSSPKPAAKILLDTSTYPPRFKPPLIAYCIDGVWKSKIPCASEVVIEDIKGAGKHELSVYLHQSQQVERWGSEGKSGLNVLRVTGLQVDAESKPVPAAPESKWALIIGDSITEGIGATRAGGLFPSGRAGPADSRIRVLHQRLRLERLDQQGRQSSGRRSRLLCRHEFHERRRRAV